ncbi:DUF1150 family protein [Mesorhizobium sp. NBSH29]|uniref:BQ00720 family protein n=1 Tax=Mesorhizobium sp. NBSH29 TaxID=2654249 RepID=UPI00189685F1|nr:DUF1150 family protein [Mesorhizobium sp. NBSH29]QPC88539.1 DUF1150 family protein [Mesorhizobium sp. NBSH29]
MIANETTIEVTPAQLAHLGEGTVAYLREMGSEELMGKFPGLPEIEPGTKLWALFAANGQPILLSDERDRAIAGALENDLTPVAIH